MSIFKLSGGGVLNVAIFGGLLFLPAGTLDWWRAWVFLGVVFVGTVASTVSVFRVNEEYLYLIFEGIKNRVNLKLLKSKTFDSGVVGLYYENA
jgi:hypothetical protein